MLRIAKILSGSYLSLALLVTLITLFITPLGWAPLQLPTLGPGSAPIVVTIAYSSEKEQWLKAAAERFAASNPRIGGHTITIVLESNGSREMVADILYGGYQPTVFSPASMLQIEQLRAANSSLIGSPQPLVITPLVLVAWEDRAEPIEQALQGDFWKQFQADLTAQKIKFGHTNPETSNSGAQTLILLAYGYHTSDDLSLDQVEDDKFLEWLSGIEQAVPSDEESSSKLITDMLRYGPSKYDFVSIYENLAIEALGSPAADNNGGLHIFYPPATILSDHPYAILNAPWVTSDQRQAAEMFRTFLLSRDIQQLASDEYGFRPANLQVQINPNDTSSPFREYAANGLQLDLPPQVTIPSGEVIDALVATWQQTQK